MEIGMTLSRKFWLEQLGKMGANVELLEASNLTDIQLKELVKGCHALMERHEAKIPLRVFEEQRKTENSGLMRDVTNHICGELEDIVDILPDRGADEAIDRLQKIIRKMSLK
jgi:hypothetical protein